MTDKLTGEWATLRAGGAVSVIDAATQLAAKPRVMLEYAARTNDPIAYDLFAGDRDLPEIADWLGRMLVQVCGTYLGQRPLLDSTSGAYPLAEEVAPLANAELAPMHIEVDVKTFVVSLSDEDVEAIGAATLKAGEDMMAAAAKLMGG